MCHSIREMSINIVVLALHQRLHARPRDATGHLPDFGSKEDMAQLGAEAFAFVNVARFAVPLRIGLALGTVPWVQRNLVDRIQGRGGGRGRM